MYTNWNTFENVQLLHSNYVKILLPRYLIQYVILNDKCYVPRRWISNRIKVFDDLWHHFLLLFKRCSSARTILETESDKLFGPYNFSFLQFTTAKPSYMLPFLTPPSHNTHTQLQIFFLYYKLFLFKNHYCHHETMTFTPITLIQVYVVLICRYKYNRKSWHFDIIPASS